MKKNTLVLFALISGTAFAQNTYSDTADVLAEIVSPITIKSNADLNFGKIAVGSTGGTVTIPANATFTAVYSDEAMEIPSNIVAPARFEINAPVGTSYSISIPSSTLSNGDDNMTVVFEHNRDDNGNIGKGVPQQLIVGGVLTVAGGQKSGEYAGEVSVTVAYE